LLGDLGVLVVADKFIWYGDGRKRGCDEILDDAGMGYVPRGNPTISHV